MLSVFSEVAFLIIGLRLPRAEYFGRTGPGYLQGLAAKVTKGFYSPTSVLCIVCPGCDFKGPKCDSNHHLNFGDAHVVLIL